MNNRRENNKRILIAGLLFLLAFTFLTGRIIYLQIAKGEEYRQMAYNQYTKEDEIAAKRGTIYDRNMKEMAISVTVEDCIISPNKINKKLTVQEQRTLKEGLCAILDIDPATYDTHVSKQTYYRKIKSSMDVAKAQEVREFISENGFEEFVELHENSTRYYPGNELASTVLGFTGQNEQSGGEIIGVYGIEKQYEEYLRGKSGKILTVKNGDQDEMPFKYESYIPAENGTNVVLTIDWNIQSFLEKQLEIALRDNKAANKVCGIVMDVNTAEVLAMSSKPDFNPNSISEFTELALEFYDSYFARPENQGKTEGDYLSHLWTNKATQELYEPGSTFKIATSAIAMEEHVVTGTDKFYCTGVHRVAGIPIHCHKTGGHGNETFEQGLQNSCNPVFMTIAERIGKNKFYEYFKAFGCNEKTGIDLPYESSAIYHNDISGFNEVELAVYSFGQTFKMTPIRLITTLCAVANGGNLMQPYVVKKIVDDDGNTIESFSPKVVRQVASEETSQNIMTYLFNGINVGSTKNAYVKGYKIAAKTGTSQKRDLEEKYGIKEYVSSCISFAPADNPQVAILILVDEPSAGAYYGGTVAAPVASAVLSDVLPYLNIETYYTDKEKENLEVQVPQYTGYNTAEAKEKAKKDGFNVIVKGSGDVVNEQLPRYTSRISADGTVILYTGKEVPSENVVVPNVKGYTASQATSVLAGKGLNITISGTYREGVSGAVALKQTPEAGELVYPGTKVEVEFTHTDSSD